MRCAFGGACFCGGSRRRRRRTASWPESQPRKARRRGTGTSRRASRRGRPSTPGILALTSGLRGSAETGSTPGETGCNRRHKVGPLAPSSRCYTQTQDGHCHRERRGQDQGTHGAGAGGRRERAQDRHPGRRVLASSTRSASTVAPGRGQRGRDARRQGRGRPFSAPYLAAPRSTSSTPSWARASPSTTRTCRRRVDAAPPSRRRTRRRRAGREAHAGGGCGSAAPTSPAARPGVTWGGVSEHHLVDITIIGGRAGRSRGGVLRGHRDASVRIVESLGQIGGQPAAVYPRSTSTTSPATRRSRPRRSSTSAWSRASSSGRGLPGAGGHDLERVSANGEEILILTTHEGEAFLTRSLIVTAGHGAFEPRKLEIEDIDDWEGRGSTTSCGARRSSRTRPA